MCLTLAHAFCAALAVVADEIIADDEAQDVAVAFAVEWGEMLERIREQQERHRQPEFVL